MRFNPPPGWPPAPPGWTPPRGWKPDPRWPAPPKGWRLWLPEQEDQQVITPSGPVQESRSHPFHAGTVEAAHSWVRSARIWLGVGLLILVVAVAGLSGLFIVVGLAALAFGMVAVLRDSRPRRLARSPKIGATIALAGLISVGLGSALTNPAPHGVTSSPRPPFRSSTAVSTPSRASTAPRTTVASTSAPGRQTPLPAPATTARSAPTATNRSTPKRKPTTRSTPPPTRGTALAALAGLSVKGRAPKTGYDRDQFGSDWTDTNHNSCNTRDDILRRDLRPVTVLADTHRCEVIQGTLADPYTGNTIKFRRGTTTSSDVQIDHIVSLSDAWQKGAQQWTSSKRVDFANHPLELLATDGSTNAAKSDSDAASWLPPNKSYRCTFVARQITIKARYRLWVTAAEQATMERVLSRCPDQRTISRTAAAKRKSRSAIVHDSAPEPVPSPPSDDHSDDGSTYYKNCDAVRAAGAAPIHTGEPGYSGKLDRDGDGVGCE